MSTLDRRSFLKAGVGAAGAFALAGPFQGLVAHAASALPRRGQRWARSSTSPTLPTTSSVSRCRARLRLPLVRADRLSDDRRAC